jgi:hypothetical protein
MPTGPQRLILIRSGCYEYAEIELTGALQIVGPNNTGKTALINTLQFLYLWTTAATWISVHTLRSRHASSNTAMFYSSVLGRLVNVLSAGAARARRVVASQNDSSTSAPSIALIFLTEGIKSARHVR